MTNFFNLSIDASIEIDYDAKLSNMYLTIRHGTLFVPKINELTLIRNYAINNRSKYALTIFHICIVQRFIKSYLYNFYHIFDKLMNISN